MKLRGDGRLPIVFGQEISDFSNTIAQYLNEAASQTFNCLELDRLRWEGINQN